ncbi:4'-phosphopantetheinyl transferase family protein [Oceanirhabdus sp. W0125-5]|uniref:4'-phosphopantetheinyl transferase family protein n=1 Tax=Oceanirhabdus sp. W0125-5 TaxID=2999116 RepID=UPI0022F2F833|nr:4'-phosphopantetheinyl transferase superfamily protein [Oceanirhabdus sp. W0125-5]WBW96393.1 4'-phosphopantetheinyl transferase superfamily protein [Oceanirhabdus sp. W0125-5]
MVEVFALKLNRDMKKDEFDKLLRLVSHEKKERILRFHRYKDSQMCLLADVFTRLILINKYNINNEKISFIKGINGKPELNKPYSNIKFNYSHSGDWIVCAVSEFNVGIDVEQIKDIDMAIAERFFSKIEYDDLMELREDKQLEYFYDLWTLKESYIKWDGRGLAIPLRDFSFRINHNNYIEFYSEKHNNKCFFKQYLIDLEYKLSVCSIKEEFCNSIEVLDLEVLIDSL